MQGHDGVLGSIGLTIVEATDRPFWWDSGKRVSRSGLCCIFCQSPLSAVRNEQIRILLGVKEYQLVLAVGHGEEGTLDFSLA